MSKEKQITNETQILKEKKRKILKNPKLQINPKFPNKLRLQKKPKF